MFVLGGERTEALDDCVGFRGAVAVAVAASGMIGLDGLQEVVGAAVVEEEGAPVRLRKGSCAEHVAGGETLCKVVGKSFAQVVDQ